MTPANEETHLAYEPDPGGVSEKLLVPQAIERRWSHVLDLYAIRLLYRINDMTVQWSRDSVTTSSTQLVEGRQGKPGWRLGPIGFGRSKLFTALDTLRDHGLITTSKIMSETGSATGLRIILHVDVLLTDMEIAVMPPKIATPKRLKAAEEVPSTSWTTPVPNTDDPRPQRGLPPSAIRTVNTEIPTQVFSQEDDANASSGADAPLQRDMFREQFVRQETEGARAAKSSLQPVATAKQAVEQVLVRNRAKRTDTVEAAKERLRSAKPYPLGQKTCSKKGVVKADDIEVVWGMSWAEAFREEQTRAKWAGQERGQALQLFNRWPRKADGTEVHGEFSEFLAYAVTNWRAVTGKLGKLRQPAPELPSIGFLQAFFPHFEGEFISRQRRKILTSFDIGEVDELVAKGNSYDSALEIVAERKVRSKIKREVRTAPAPAPARPRPRPVQPVATERPLPRAEMQPTNLTRQRVARKSAADWDREFFGTPAAPTTRTDDE